LLQGRSNKVLVQIDIEKGIILGDSTVAKLDTDLLGGGGSIILDVGDLGHPLKLGDTLVARVDPGLAELFKQSTEPITNNLPVTIAKLNKLMDEFEGVGDTLKMTMVSITKSSNSLRATLVKNKPKLDSALSQVNTVMALITQRVKEIRPVIKKFSLLADSLNNLEMANTLNKLNATLDKVTSTLDKLTNKEGTIGKLMSEDKLYQNLNKTLNDMDSLLIHMNENPKHFFAPLGKKRKKIERDLQKQRNN